MNILIFGGAGFIGLSLAARALGQGHDVTLFDRAAPPAFALAAFADLPGACRAVTGDVTDEKAVADAMAPGFDIVILGAAITAGSARDAADPETILAVNLLAQTPILRQACATGVRRVVNLSSAAAYGAAGARVAELDEDCPGDPVGLYAISKWASERVGARLASLWGLDLVSVRLTGVFGPYEYATGARDTLSPLFQIMRAAHRGEPALLERPGLRDWGYGPDIAGAILRIAAAPAPRHRLYNISTGAAFSALDWGRALMASRPGFVCRLAEPGEAATIDLHGPGDRAPLSIARFAGEYDWRPGHDRDASAADLDAWWRRHGDHLDRGP